MLCLLQIQDDQPSVSQDSLEADDMDQSLLDEYEQRLNDRQNELKSLVKQREDLLRMQNMLQDLTNLTIQSEQGKSADKRQQELSQDVASQEKRLMEELKQQNELREALRMKNQRLQQLQMVSTVKSTHYM